MSSLTVRFVGPVRRPVPERAMEVDTSGLSTVDDLLDHLGYRPDERTTLHVLADGVRRSHDEDLSGVEVIEILIAIGGG